MGRWAAELRGCADLHVVTDDEAERFGLVPHNERAVEVTVEHLPRLVGGEVSIGLGGALIPVHPTSDWPDWISCMDQVISSVVAGRVVVREGPGRRRFEIGMPGGGTYAWTEGGSPLGWLPLFGWRRRARVVRCEPY